jgi:hypothetical protein
LKKAGTIGIAGSHCHFYFADKYYSKAIKELALNEIKKAMRMYQMAFGSLRNNALSIQGLLCLLTGVHGTGW